MYDLIEFLVFFFHVCSEIIYSFYCCIYSTMSKTKN